MNQREISRENYKYFELSENKNIIYYNLWDIAKQGLEGNLQHYIVLFDKNEEAKINKASILGNQKKRNNLRLKQAE